MKKTHFYLLLTVGLLAIGMTKSEKLKSKHIFEAYPLFIHPDFYEYEGKEYVSLHLDNLKEEHFLAPFVNENWAILDYLFVNYSKTFSDESLSDFKSNKVMLNSYIEKSLNSDTLFNTNVLQLANNYLKNQDITITDIKAWKKKSISLDSIAKVASRFYYLQYFKEEKPRYKFCVGTNGCTKDKSNQHLPIVEAFCFQLIRYANNDVWNDFDKYKKEIAELVNKKDENELLFLRDLMFQKMGDSKSLRTYILEEYAKKKDYLTFIVE